jgi:hypothetical protein
MCIYNIETSLKKICLHVCPTDMVFKSLPVYNWDKVLAGGYYCLPNCSQRTNWDTRIKHGGYCYSRMKKLLLVISGANFFHLIFLKKIYYWKIDITFIINLERKRYEMLVSVSVVALTSSSLKIKQNGGAFLCILHRLFLNIIHWFLLILV